MTPARQTKAIIRRPSQRAERALGDLDAEAFAAMEIAPEELTVQVEHQLAHGALISGDAAQLRQLEEQGYTVKTLPDANILAVGSYRIDIEAEPPEVPKRLEVPVGMRKSWPHHLVQLQGPPTAAWVQEIEARGVDVVESIGAYGLFVSCTPQKAQKLLELPYVVWIGAFKPAYRLAPGIQQMQGTIRYVSVGVYPASALPQVTEELRTIGATVIDEWGQEGSYNDEYRVVIVETWARRLAPIARIPWVRWLEYHAAGFTLDDERSAQITAHRLNGAGPAPQNPVPGYQALLGTLGLSGAGVVIGICDTGVDTNSDATLHPDLRGRLAFFVDQTHGVTLADVNGHGTHIAGIAAGNAQTQVSDPQGFLLGQGIAPGARFGVLNAVDTEGGPGTSPVAQFTQLMVANGAHIMNNSWQQPISPGYGDSAALVDRLVRDPDPTSPNSDYLVLVFSAGNEGPDAQTITPPKEAKNPIVVGNSMNFRPGEAHHSSSSDDDIRGVNRKSSRGPAADGRILPTVVAPGTDIISARPSVDSNPATLAIERPRTPYSDTAGTVHADYTARTGTSMSAAHVSGVCALLVEWWRNLHGGNNPSPALLKALLINGAVDLVGGPDGKGGALTHIPNHDQGWGRVCLENIIRSDPATGLLPKVIVDQEHVFSADQPDDFLIQVTPVEGTRPLRITLVWSDSPGNPSSAEALVNDLDLAVTESVSGKTYKGNVFENGLSTTFPGDEFDRLNNVECVYIGNPAGTYQVAVLANVLRQDARPPFSPATPWQDFALVIDNAQVVG